MAISHNKQDTLLLSCISKRVYLGLALSAVTSIDRAGLHAHLHGAGRLTSETVCSGAGCTMVVFSNRAGLCSLPFTLRSLFIPCDTYTIDLKVSYSVCSVKAWSLLLAHLL